MVNQNPLLRQGDAVRNANGATVGNVQFDQMTGQRLNQGQYSNPAGAAFNINSGQSFVQPNMNTPFPVANLNATPLNIPTMAASTAATGAQEFIASTSAANQTFAQQQEQAAIDAAQNELAGSKSTLQNIFQRIAGIPQNQEAEYQKQGVDTAKQQVDDYTSQIEAEQLATRRQTEALQKNPQGMFGGAVEQEINRVNRESVSKQADLAILQNAALRKYDTATAIADRKIAAETESLKAQLDYTKFFYEDNKDNLTKKEQRQYETKIRADERAYNETVDNKKQVNQIGLQFLQEGGSPAIAKQILNAKTPEEALALTGNTLGLLDRQLKQAQLANVYSTIAERKSATNAAKIDTPESGAMDKDPDFKKIKGNSELKAALTEYQRAVEEAGGAVRSNNPKSGTLENKYGAVLQAYRAAVDLGALQGADIALVDNVIKKAVYDNVGFWGTVGSLGIANAVRDSRNTRAVNNSIKSAFDTIDTTNQRLTGILATKNPSWLETPYYQAVTTGSIPNSQSQSNTEEGYLNTVDGALVAPNSIYQGY